MTPFVSICCQAIAKEIGGLLDAAVAGGAFPEAVLPTWVSAFMSTVFNKPNVENRVSVVPYMEVCHRA